MNKKISAVGIAAFSLLMAGCSDGSSEAGSDDNSDTPDPVTIRAVMALPSEYPENTGFLEEFIPALEDRASWITVDVVGGPEVVPEVDQAEAISNGAYDMAMIAPSYSEGLIPGVSSGMLTPNTPSEDREAGTLDLYNELFLEPHGMTTLGLQQDSVEAGLYLGQDACDNFDPDNPSLAGSVIRGGPQYVEAVEYLGGSIVSMPVGEIYNAIERGVIDGYGGTAMGIPFYGTVGVTGCLMQPEFKGIVWWQTVNTAWWESLDEETRTAIEETVIEVEGAIEDRYETINEEGYQQLADDGIEMVEMSPEASEDFLEAVYDASWDNMIAANPDVERLREHWGQ